MAAAEAPTITTLSGAQLLLAECLSRHIVVSPGRTCGIFGVRISAGVNEKRPARFGARRSCLTRG
jgi:hypothetical protein